MGGDAGGGDDHCGLRLRMFFAQRTYQAHMTYALITPKVPTAMELETSPQLAKLNGDNPIFGALTARCCPRC